VSRLVADASIVIKWILEEPGSDDAALLIANADHVYAPEIVLAECANAIWKRVARGWMDIENALLPLSDLMALPVLLVGLRALTPSALDLALAYGHPIHDCYYLAAAVAHDCPLATADRRLHELAVRAGLGERTILVG